MTDREKDRLKEQIKIFLEKYSVSPIYHTQATGEILAKLEKDFEKKKVLMTMND